MARPRCAYGATDVGLPGSPARAAWRNAVKYRRMPIEEESPEQFGYDRIRRQEPLFELNIF